MKPTNRFTPKVIEKLGYYVYMYIDPRTSEPFYIGKGRANRAFSHLRDRSETAKARVIDELSKQGLHPTIEILKYGLSEEQALLVEATAIDLADVKKLTNKVRGHGIKHGARASTEEIAATLDATEVTIREPTILITINRAFRYGMSPLELYDVTRSAWKMGDRRLKATLAMSVYSQIVREVYKIAEWTRGGATMRNDDLDGRHDDIPDRWEFVGKVASESLRKKYVGKSVADYCKKGAQNPIHYVNC